MKIGQPLPSALVGALVTGGLAAVAMVRTRRRSINQPGRYLQRLLIDGWVRHYRLTVPQQYDGHTPCPLVVALHWATGSSAQMAAATGFDTLAERTGWIVAYPDSLPGERTWNAGYCCGQAATDGIDDVAFLRALLVDLQSHLAIDPSRIFLTGFSNGAMLAYLAGTRLADQIAGIAAVAGSIGGSALPMADSPSELGELGDQAAVAAARAVAAGLQRVRGDHPAVGSMQPSQPGRPIPVLIIHGRHDDLVPFDGGPSDIGVGRYDHLPVAAAVDLWRQSNGCDPTPVVTRLAGGMITRQCWGGDSPRSRVQLDILEEGGHDWPGHRLGWGRRFRQASDGYRASEVIWAFFQG